MLHERFKLSTGSVTLTGSAAATGVRITTVDPRSVPAAREAGSPPGSWAHMTPDPGSSPADPAQRGRGDPCQSAPHRGRGRDRSPHRLVAQGAEVGDFLTTCGQHRSHVDQHLAPVVDRGEVSLGQRRRQLPGQPDPVGEQPDCPDPANASTPVPSPVTDKPRDHPIRFT